MGGSAVSSGTDLSVDAGIGEDIKREGLRDTPKVYAILTSRERSVLGKSCDHRSHSTCSHVIRSLQHSVWRKHGWMHHLDTERLPKGDSLPQDGRA